MSQEKTEFILIGDQIFNKAEIVQVSHPYPNYIYVSIKKDGTQEIRFRSDKVAIREWKRVKSKLIVP